LSGWPARIGVIGAGAMGTALAAGLLRGGTDLAGRLCFADVYPAAAQLAAAETGGRPCPLPEAAAADLVCLAVKPADADAAMEEIRPSLDPGAVVLSVVLGLSLDRLAAAVPEGVAVVRTMPNLAVRHGAGVVVMAAHGLPADREEQLRVLLMPLGPVLELPEALFPAATALAGSGPGLVALVAEGLEDGAVAVGLSRRAAREMVQAVLSGTAALLADGGDPATLRQRVSSPAGSTIEGLAVLERGAVRAHLADAVRAAAAAARDAGPSEGAAR
jgi:pyrroline-5-carboxylate reductase